jgi:hypothetical protein
MIMKLRSLILAFAVVTITVSSLSGCVVVPARGYVAGPPVAYHPWGYDRRW